MAKCKTELKHLHEQIEALMKKDPYSLEYSVLHNIVMEIEEIKRQIDN